MMAPQEELEPGVKQVFCVTMPPSGNPVKLTGTSLDDVIPSINGSLITWINCTVGDVRKDAPIVSSKLGFDPNIIPTLLSGYHAAYEDFGICVGIMVPAVAVSKLELDIYPLFILLRKDLIVTIHGEKVKRLVKFSRYADIVLRKIPQNVAWNDRLTIVLTRILDENNEKNFEGLRSIEEQGDEIGRYLLDPSTPRDVLGLEIYKMKHALITYLDILWSTLDVINSLRYGDADVITDDPKILKRIGLLADDITRQISLSEQMSTVLASGLEVLQSIYNNQLQVLNNRMALVITWLTILGTAVLVPNTLATVLSNPAYALTTRDAPWFTGLIILSTIVSTWLAYAWVKRKGWMPAKVE
ncbi:MAG: magnesium transporter CorA [Euryarchaeota archaeon]|nr:magnesium transporter CorA [Euryarchaeota archaeon]